MVSWWSFSVINLIAENTPKTISWRTTREKSISRNSPHVKPPCNQPPKKTKPLIDCVNDCKNSLCRFLHCFCVSSHAWTWCNWTTGLQFCPCVETCIWTENKNETTSLQSFPLLKHRNTNEKYVLFVKSQHHYKTPRLNWKRLRDQKLEFSKSPLKNT